MQESAVELGSLDRVHAGDFVVVVLVGVILHTVLVLLDSHPEHLEALICVALVLTLVEICSRVSLELLLDPNEVLLGV
jgi:hypothetical protein